VAASAVVAGLVITLPHGHQGVPDASVPAEIAAPPHDARPDRIVDQVTPVDKPLRLERTAATRRGTGSGAPTPTTRGHQADTSAPASTPAEQTARPAEPAPSSGPAAPPAAETPDVQQPQQPQQPEPSQPAQPARPKLVDVHASVSAGPDGIEVGVGLGVGGVTAIPDTTLGVPLGSLG
jgi:hypothetical protein